MKKKKVIPVVVLLLVIGAGGIFYYWFGGREAGHELMLRGEVEGTIYSQISEVPGKIVEMPVELGAPVQTGDLIARLDNSDQVYALEQLQIALEKKRLVLASLQKGAKQEEIGQAANNINIAEANYRSAEANYKQIASDVASLTKLWEAGGLPQGELDSAKLKETAAAEALEAARNQVGNAEEQLSLLRRGADAEALAIAEADITEIESKIRQTEEALAKYVITANCDGVVISKNYSLGAMVNGGYNVADISAAAEKYVVCYLPEEKSAQISYGQELAVRAGTEEYRGEVRFIDVKSQYTPKDMQTSATRNKVSVKIKILLPADAPLNPGSKADVIFDL